MKKSIMKKISCAFLILLCFALTLGSLASCADKKNDKADSNGDDQVKVDELFDYENADLSEYIELGTYKNNSFEIKKTEVTDTEVTAQINALLSQNNVFTKITDRAAEKGDTVVVDYTGYMEGKAFSGGAAKNAMLNLVENSGYIEGFAEGVIGHTPGEEFSVFVTFPENYGHVAYAGKDAEFVFKLHYIVEYSVTDEFASKYSDGKCTSAADFNEYIKEELRKAKYDDAVNNAVWNKIRSDAKVKKYPEQSVNYYFAILKAQCESIAKQLGTTYENALVYLSITEETLVEYAQNYTKEDLIMYSVAKLENCLPTDADMNSFAAYYAENNFSSLKSEMIAEGYSQDSISVESAAAYAKEHHAKYMRVECLRTKTGAFLISNNTFVEK